jgi:hypothetical protein
MQTWRESKPRGTSICQPLEGIEPINLSTSSYEQTQLTVEVGISHPLRRRPWCTAILVSCINGVANVFSNSPRVICENAALRDIQSQVLLQPWLTFNKLWAAVPERYPKARHQPICVAVVTDHLHSAGNTPGGACPRSGRFLVSMQQP